MQSKERIVSELADKTLEDVKFVVENFGDRYPSSKGESRAQNFLSEALCRNFGGTVEKKQVDMSSTAYLGAIPFCVVLALVSLLTYFAIPVVSILFLLIDFVVIIAEYVLNLDFIDGFTLPKKANNVVWRDSNTSAEKQIFLVCHTDATFERRIKNKFGTRAYIAVMILSLVGLIYLFAISLAFTVDHFSSSFDLTENIVLSFDKYDIYHYDFYGYLTLLFLPEWICLFFFKNKVYTTEGVGDGLLASVTAVYAVKAVKELGINLRNTSLGVVYFCGGTCGKKGAKNFLSKNKAEFKGKQTYFIDLENVSDKKWLQVTTRDCFGTVKSDKYLQQVVSESAKENGIPIEKGVYKFMYSDGGILSRGGLKSVTVSADSVFNENRHTRKDNLYAVKPTTVSTLITLLTSVFEKIDKE